MSVVHALQLGELVGVLGEALRDAAELADVAAGAVLQVHLQPAGGAEAGDLRKVEREGDRLP